MFEHWAVGSTSTRCIRLDPTSKTLPKRTPGEATEVQSGGKSEVWSCKCLSAVFSCRFFDGCMDEGEPGRLKQVK